MNSPIISRRTTLVAATTFAATAAMGATEIIATARSQPAPAKTAGPSASPDEAAQIALEAYLYLYPIITMDVTRRQLTNAEPEKQPGRGPHNAFAHIRTFPDANFKEVVRPNFDTLYSSTWLDLTQEPMIVSVPDTGDRYYLMPILDMWTDVIAAPGKRTSGTKAADFAVVPPGWEGELPRGVQKIAAPTPYVWIIGRTQTNGPKDYEAVHKVQGGYRITPLSQWGQPARPAPIKIDANIDSKTPPLEQVNAMPAEKYFAYGAELMKHNPPHATDWSMLARMKRIGLEPGKLNVDDLSKETRAALAHGAKAGLKQMQDKVKTVARVTNGWQMNTDTMGVYGNYYLKRAIIALVGLGANQPEDAIYPLNLGDADGKPLEGGNKYVISFKKEELPPVDAFWSLTMYDKDGFQVANPLNRFAIGDRDTLKYGDDGSLKLFIQSDNPGGDKEANWLPSPKTGELGVTMRLYAPKPEVIEGRWNPPPVTKVD